MADDWSSVADPSPQQVRQKLRAVLHELEQRQADYLKLRAKAVEDEHAFRVAWAKAMFKATGSASKDREAEALIETDALRLEAKTSEALADATRDSIFLLRDTLVALESIASSQRTEMELAGREWRAA